jgi:hypothetical protein
MGARESESRMHERHEKTLLAPLGERIKVRGLSDEVTSISDPLPNHAIDWDCRKFGLEAKDIPKHDGRTMSPISIPEPGDRGPCLNVSAQGR